jgi:hypothetical protein
MLAIHQGISTEKECLRSAEQERLLKSERGILILTIFTE